MEYFLENITSLSERSYNIIEIHTIIGQDMNIFCQLNLTLDIF